MNYNDDYYEIERLNNRDCFNNEETEVKNEITS